VKHSKVMTASQTRNAPQSTVHGRLYLSHCWKIMLFSLIITFQPTDNFIRYWEYS